MTRFVQLKDSISKRETMVNPERVQLLEDETDGSGARVRIIFGPGQSMLVEGKLEDVAEQLSK
jgi:hypothetical protein